MEVSIAPRPHRLMNVIPAVPLLVCLLQFFLLFLFVLRYFLLLLMEVSIALHPHRLLMQLHVLHAPQYFLR
ncbi:unnamed protein product [Meloidogyne enterolobii]|uniref:Uncharacterized protein n=1 Tax=Meloidogyne enterolobii TaxID=390850 RepID=A0ACB0XRP3_MELEN